MNRLMIKGIGVTAIAGALTLFAAAPTEAAFVAYICDDVACTGGGDTIVTDGGVGDLGISNGIAGRINMEAAAGGLTVITNIAKSKPLVGSAANPIMDITFSAEGIGAAYLWAVDTDFTGLLPLHGTLDGNFSGQSCVQGNIGTSTANAGALVVGSTTDMSCASPFALQVNHGVAAGSPYSLAIAVYVSRAISGTTTGDFLVVPEPASLGLLGLGLAGIAARRRRQVVQG